MIFANILGISDEKKRCVGNTTLFNLIKCYNNFNLYGMLFELKEVY